MPLWRVQEAAEYLGIRPKTLYEWVRTGRVPHRKLGFNVRFEAAELEEWVRKSARSMQSTLASPGGIDELRSAAAAAAVRLRRLESEVGTQLSFPERQSLQKLARRLEAAVEAFSGES